MAFVTEQDVRDEGFLDHLTVVPPQQLQICIERAHAEILRSTTLTDESVVTANIRRGEALLTLAYFFQALAISSAVTAEEIRTVGIRINEHRRTRELLEISHTLWETGWTCLYPYARTGCPLALQVIPGGCP
ncbi:MAG: hypothetical protein ACOX5R_04765 [bacterium]|jgi:hypothetical protein